jgi:PPE-repeat protein
MWAQDAAAMYGYAGSSAAASTLTPFDQPAETTNPAGQVAQGSAVTRAAGTPAGTGAQTVDQVMSAVPTALQGLSSPVSAASNPALAIPGQGILADLLNFLDGADGNAYGTFLNSSLFNGLVSAGYVSPAVIEPAVTGALADVNAVSVAAQPTAAALPPMGAGSGNALWTPLVTPPAAGMAAASAGMPGVDLSGVSAGTRRLLSGDYRCRRAGRRPRRWRIRRAPRSRAAAGRAPSGRPPAARTRFHPRCRGYPAYPPPRRATGSATVPATGSVRP